MTVDWWCATGASWQRHGDRHGDNGLDKRLPRHHDSDDAYDGRLRTFSKWGTASF